MRAGHEHTYTALSPHRVFGCAACIARRGSQNIQCLTSASQLVLKQIAKQLHGHVFKSQRWAVRQALNVEAVF